MKIKTSVLQIEDFMLYCVSKKLSKKTLLSYEQALRLFTIYLENEYEIDDLERVTKRHIQMYIKYLQERGKYTVFNLENNNNPKARGDFEKEISNNTINNYLRNIKVFFNWFSDEEELKENPVEKIKLLKQTERIKESLSKDEIKLILRSFNKSKFHEFRDFVITLLILDSGCRISELLAVKVIEIDFKNNVILLSRHNTKNKKDRLVYFSDRVKKELKLWMQYKDRYLETDLLFCSNRGNQLKISCYERTLRLIGKNLGIELYPHRLRANFAQWYIFNGGDLMSLSRILGHSDIEVTKVYLQLNDRDIHNQYKKVSPMGNMVF